MAQRQPDETLEKLSRGVEESRRTAQRRAMELAQEYFGDSVEALKQQMSESRSRLESLPDEVPGGREESFQMLFRELMENYSKLEGCLEEARRNVSGLDAEKLERRGEALETAQLSEAEGTDAASREAQRRGVELDEVEGTGTGGRVVAEDVRSYEERQTGRPEATDAALREARERGIDLSKVEATGAEGQVIVSDVVEFSGRATRDTTGKASDPASRATATSAQGEAGSPVSQTEGVAGEVTDTAAGVLGEATGRTGGTSTENGREEPRVTDAARRKAEEMGVSLSDVTGTGSGGQITISDVTGAEEDDRGAVGQASKQTSGIPGRGRDEGRETDVSGEPLATKAARRRAERLGVDLSRVEGTGSNGLITIEDVLGARSG